MQRPKPNVPDWLPDSVVYQVYPQSFFDTNSDGIGDLRGIAAKLDYICSVGCNVVWINPCFDSPFQDAGYDIRDFYKIAPRYGDLNDLKFLLDEAHRREMRIVLDLVAGHTSVEHPWFRESAKAEPNEFTNRYIWTDNVWKAPGGDLESVKGFEARDGQYLSNFFHFQPSLNFGFANPDPEKKWQLPVDHPDSRATLEALWDILKYWLNLGVDGFRVDMAFSLVKNDPEREQTIRLWRRIRERWDEHFPNALLISEWSIPAEAIAAGFHLDFMLHFNNSAYTKLFRQEPERDCFHLSTGGQSVFDGAGAGDFDGFWNLYLEQHSRANRNGYISIPSGNHDIMRISEGRSHDDLKVAFAFLLTLPGIPCIYYGDEIGMLHNKDIPSKEGGYGRTGGRTPMQWDDSNGAGFSEAPVETFYLPVPENRGPNTVASQDRDPTSLLNCIRSLIEIRKKFPSLSADGEIERVMHPGDSSYPIVYLRQQGDDRCVVILNPTHQPRTFQMEGSLSEIVSHHATIQTSDSGCLVSMQPSAFFIGREAES